MATINRFRASHEADMLKGIILEAVTTHNQHIIAFTYRVIFPLYQMASIEASEEIDDELVMRLKQVVVN